ncbi:MAG: DUF115 domain-containing protein [Treponema sp.]|jgi:hypothetical protein|nr:DUF115 domain-containing protein [Treponema sp.]
MPDDGLQVTAAGRGFSVSWNGLSLLSRRDPVSQGEKLAGNVIVRERTLWLCPSPLYGYGLSRLLERLASCDEASAVLCAETNPALFSFSILTMDKILAGNSRLALCGEREPEAVCGFVRRQWGSRRFRRVETLRLSGGWRLDEAGYDAIAAALRQEIALDWGNALTLSKLGRRFALNTVRNLALIPRFPPLSRLSYGGSPVLVTGAGPSLDPFLGGLLDHFGEKVLFPSSRPFRIVSVDTSLSVLGARGIKPDLVIALESQHWNLRDFIGAGGQGIPLAMDLSALPATADVLGGEVFLFFTPWAEIRFLKRIEAAFPVSQFPPLSSVGLSAVAIALSLGKGPVICAGIDFSFNPDTYHARSSPGHLERLKTQNRFHSLPNTAAAIRPGVLQTPAKNGIPVLSDGAMRAYRDLFERNFSGEKRLFDTESSGLPLGIPVLNGTEALKTLEVAAASGAATVTDTATASGAAAVTGAFIERELSALRSLLSILTGERRGTGEELEALLDFCDYLWAYFPDCAGAGGRRPPAADISFLKRVRTEIGPFLSLFGKMSRFQNMS